MEYFWIVIGVNSLLVLVASAFYFIHSYRNEDVVKSASMNMTAVVRTIVGLILMYFVLVIILTAVMMFVIDLCRFAVDLIWHYLF